MFLSVSKEARWLVRMGTGCSQAAHLLLLEDDLVEKVLEVLIGVVNAQLLKAVEAQVLLGEEPGWVPLGQRPSNPPRPPPASPLRPSLPSTVAASWN